MAQSRQQHVQELQREAELAMQHSDEEAEELLEELLRLAEEGSDAALFAHRHLAEMRLESNSWQCALHLRQVVRAYPNDDIAHALMGLCQGLLGNYRTAIASYHKALRTSATTPWYHHNIGHLTDVALNDPERAEPYLRRAFELEPDHDEIMGSLAHCLARLGRREEARDLACAAMANAPCNDDHRALLKWIDSGASGACEQRMRYTSAQPLTKEHEVASLLRDNMHAQGCPNTEIERALALWRDVQSHCNVRVIKPEVYAAALEYAMAVIHGRARTQAFIARRYGVAPTSVSTRFTQIRQALSLQPGDPRYATLG